MGGYIGGWTCGSMANYKSRFEAEHHLVFVLGLGRPEEYQDAEIVTCARLYAWAVGSPWKKELREQNEVRRVIL